MSECGIRLTAKGEKPRGRLAPEDERREAEFIARSYATSLFAGVERHTPVCCSQVTATVPRGGARPVLFAG